MPRTHKIKEARASNIDIDRSDSHYRNGRTTRCSGDHGGRSSIEASLWIIRVIVSSTPARIPPPKKKKKTEKKYYRKGPLVAMGHDQLKIADTRCRDKQRRVELN